MTTVVFRDGNLPVCLLAALSIVYVYVFFLAWLELDIALLLGGRRAADKSGVVRVARGECFWGLLSAVIFSSH